LAIAEDALRMLSPIFARFSPALNVLTQYRSASVLARPCASLISAIATAGHRR
jgi:hypothetical protein